jgi:hypothetical protein
METITINKENLQKAFSEAGDYPEIQTMLRTLFGDDVEEPQQPIDVTEHIKTFHDAYCELGNEHPFVKSYEKYVNTASGEENDVIAYLKLRIITEALNEGWHPTFTDDEYRYFPWFYIYSKEEWESLDDDAKRRCVGRSFYYAYSGGGLVFASAGNASSYLHSHICSRLAFKSEELAVYAGKQFIDIWVDYICA